MAELLTGLGPALIALGPFGVMLLVVLILVAFLVIFRKNRFEEDKSIAGFRSDSMEEIREDVARERSLRRELEKKVQRYMEALEIWRGYAYGKQLDQMSDRLKHEIYEIKHGIEPLILPEIKELPRLIEADEPKTPAVGD